MKINNDDKQLMDELFKCLSEAVDLIDDIMIGDYKPDSLTTQPWLSVLEEYKMRDVNE